MKVGAAFFGWLTATGMAVLLTAVAGAAGAAVGVARTGSAGDAAGTAADNAGTVGVAGAVVLAVVIFLSYLAGGYVAGRMARWNGARQGVAVWLWAVVVAVAVAIVTAVAGAQYNVLGRLNSFPRLGLDDGTVTSVGLVSLLVVAVLSLVGAVLGGLTGMRYHRKMDRAGFAGPR